MNSLKMAGVDLRSLVKSDEPDLVFLDGNTASIMLEDLNYLDSDRRRQYVFWLMTVDPMEFLEKDLLSKPFFHPRLIAETFEPHIAPNYASFPLDYSWGFMTIDFIDHSRYPYPFEDKTDTVLVNPEAFTRDQKLFSIEIEIEPTAMIGSMVQGVGPGDASFADRLIDMDIIEIALRYKDAFFFGGIENQKRHFWRPGRHIKRFEDAPDTWLFDCDFAYNIGQPDGDDRFFALRKRMPEAKIIYALGDEMPDIIYEAPFSGYGLQAFNGTDDLYLGDFPLFRGRNPMDLFLSKTTD